MRPMRAEAQTFLHATLGFWAGIYAFRAFVPTAVWNLSDALPLYAKGSIAILVHLVGVAGCLLPFVRKPRAPAMLATAVAIAAVLRQLLLGSDVFGSAFSLLGWILWLWWLAAFTQTLVRGRAHLVAPALAAGWALQIGMQAAWHGLDLPVARGALAVLCAVALHVAFVLSAPRAQDAAEQAQKPSGTSVLVLLGPVMFLEVTLLANVGRIAFISGLGLLASVLLVQAALLVGLLLTRMAGKPVLFIAELMLLIAAAAFAPRLHGPGVVLLLLGQAAVIPLLAAAATRETLRPGVAFAIGTLLLFALVFLFYNAYESPPLWTLAALLLLLALPVAELPVTPLKFAVPLLLAALLAGTGSIGRRAAPAPRARAERLLTYNLHQGFDAAGVPAMQRIADEIARLDADVIALQEVGRGWTLLGGADLIAYLHYRLPGYAIDYVPLNGQLWGIALVSRVAARSPLRSAVFRAPAGAFRYGFASRVFDVDGVPVRVFGVHLTAGLEGHGADARIDQMNQLMSAAARDSSVLIMGDFNTHPDEAPVRQLLASGYHDAVAEAGAGGIATWPASAPDERIDYMFARAPLRWVRVTIPRTTASDHLPVLAQTRGVRRATTMR